MTGSKVKIKNWDCDKYGDRSFRQGHPSMPRESCRISCVGVSSSGKTNLIIDLILRYLCWDRLFVFSPSVAYQPKYLMLKDACETMEIKREKKALDYCKRFNKDKPANKHICLEDLDLKPIGEFYNEIGDFKLDNLEKGDQNFILLDDIVLDKNQLPFIEIFSKGRHRNCQVAYLSQDWFSINKMVRRNSNLFILFGQLPEMNIDMIRRDSGVPKDKAEWRRVYLEATKEPYSFITIDKTKKGLDKQFTRNFNEPLFGKGRDIDDNEDEDTESSE